MLRPHICLQSSFQPPWTWMWCSCRCPSSRASGQLGTATGAHGLDSLLKPGAWDLRQLSRGLEHRTSGGQETRGRHVSQPGRENVAGSSQCTQATHEARWDSYTGDSPATSHKHPEAPSTNTPLPIDSHTSTQKYPQTGLKQ